MAVAAFETTDIFLENQQLIEHAPENVERLPEGLSYTLHELSGFDFITRRARRMGEDIRDTRMQMLREGQFDDVPMPVDMTGTARRAIEAEHEHGVNSQEAKDWHEALRGDTDRQVAEATSKMTWGYFKPLVHTFDAEVQAFVAYGHSVREIHENGISPMAHAEDIDRSINDYVHERSDEAFIQSPYADEYVAFMLSPCPDWAIEEYEEDVAQGHKKKAYGGNVPEIEKYMIRATSYSSEKQERYLEQAAIPGTTVEMEDILDTLYILGVLEPGQRLTKTELHATRIMVRKDVMSSVLDMQKLLDAVTTERTGQTVFMGEVVESGEELDYSLVPAESDRRNQEFAGVSEKLAQKMLELEREGIDKWQTEIHVSAFLKNSLLEVVKKTPEQARVIFDDATADGLITAQQHREAGRLEEALALETQVEARAPAPSSCGAGSCGLEGVSAGSKEDVSLRKKLNAEDGDTIIKDKERACRCGKKSIVYAFNKNKVNKYCESCGAFETKITKR